MSLFRRLCLLVFEVSKLQLTIFLMSRSSLFPINLFSLHDLPYFFSLRCHMFTAGLTVPLQSILRHIKEPDNPINLNEVGQSFVLHRQEQFLRQCSKPSFQAHHRSSILRLKKLIPNPCKLTLAKHHFSVYYGYISV